MKLASMRRPQDREEGARSRSFRDSSFHTSYKANTFVILCWSVECRKFVIPSNVTLVELSDGGDAEDAGCQCRREAGSKIR